MNNEIILSALVQCDLFTDYILTILIESTDLFLKD